MFLHASPDQTRTEDFSELEDGIRVFFKGYVIREGRILRDEQFIPVLAGHYRSGILQGEIRGYNGNFEFVICREGEVLAGNDRYGIYPLFYTMKDREFILSTRWERLIPFSGRELRGDSLLEVLAFGNTLGDKTLIRNIHELDPACLLRISVRDRELIIDRERYWELRHRFIPAPLESLEKELAALWKTQIGIYCDFIRENGNCCVQLLSGGLDSRLLAHEFDQSGITIHAITYGNGETSGEIIAAREVMAALGDRHTHRIFFVDSRELDRIVRSRVRYDRITQVRNAEKELYSYHELKDTCNLRIPGYSGDFTAGSHIRYSMRSWDSKQDIINYILRYKVSPLIRRDLMENPEHRSMLLRSLNESISDDGDRISALVKWDLEFRQRRYIVRPEVEENSGSTNFLLPFFDYELMDFFLGLPVQALLNTKLYMNTQIKYLYSSNPRLIRIKRDNRKQPRIIGNNFIREYREKFSQLIHRYLDPGRKHALSNWSDEIDWQKHLDSWDLPGIISEFHINTRNVEPFYLTFLLSLAKLKNELSEL